MSPNITTPKATPLKQTAPEPEVDEVDEPPTAEEVATGYTIARVRDLGNGRIEKTIRIRGEKIVQIEENGKEKWNFA